MDRVSTSVGRDNVRGGVVTSSVGMISSGMGISVLVPG